MDTKPSHRTGQAIELSSAAPLKICTKCKRELVITEFHRDRGCRSGHHPSCKACVRVYCVGKSPAKKAELAALKRQFRLAHPERVRLQKLVQWHRNRAAASSTHFTAKQWLKLLKKYDHRCVYCGVAESEASGQTLTVDHVRPISKGGSNGIRNIQPLCKSCNSRKRQSHIDYRKAYTAIRNAEVVKATATQEMLPTAA